MAMSGELSHVSHLGSCNDKEDTLDQGFTTSTLFTQIYHSHSLAQPTILDCDIILLDIQPIVNIFFNPTYLINICLVKLPMHAYHSNGGFLDSFLEGILPDKHLLVSILSFADVEITLKSTTYRRNNFLGAPGVQQYT